MTKLVWNLVASPNEAGTCRFYWMKFLPRAAGNAIKRLRSSRLVLQVLGRSLNPEVGVLKPTETALESRRSDRGAEIEAFIDPQNNGSIALALRLGMEATQTFSGGAQRFLMPPS